MGFSIAEMLGGAIAITLISFIIEALLFKSDEPMTRAIKTAGLALIIAAVLSGFGSADGGPFVWTAGLNYVPGAIAVFLWFKSRYASKWSSEPEE
jgi:Ca2+/Na+ antiporter